MKIKRWYARKINLGTFETSDFGCQYEDEWKPEMDKIDPFEEMSDRLHNICKEDVEKSISEFQSNLLRDKLNSRLTVGKSELKELKRHPTDNKLKINELTFQLGLIQYELNELKGSKK